MPFTELPGFEDRVRRHTWKGNVLPVLYEGGRYCPRCQFGTVIALEPFVEEALFFHGGYGEAQRRTVDACLSCGRTSIRRSESIAPIRRVRLG